MTVKIYWRNGDKSKWTPTFLPFADGFLIEYEHLHVDNLDTLGVRVSRGYHSTDPGDADARVICEEKVIVRPDELGNVLAISDDGAIKLMYDPGTDRLTDVQTPQLEAIVFGEGQPGGTVVEASKGEGVGEDVLQPDGEGF